MNISILSTPKKLVMLDDVYCLTQVSFPERIQEIGTLRILAWRDEAGVSTDFFNRRTWIESIDHTAFHWIVTYKNTVVAAARMSIHHQLEDVPYVTLLPEAYWSRYERKTVASINRLVVDPRFRGRGLARLLDQVRLDTAISMGVDVIVGQTSMPHRRNSLTRLGFSYVCESPHTPEMPERPLFFMDLDVKNRTESTNRINGARQSGQPGTSGMN